MKIALCSSFVPFVSGGARNIVNWLEAMLQEAGHHVEVVNLPQVDDPNSLFKQMCAFRWVHLENADRIICFRPQAHLIPHPHKILWFIHHIRVFYDLWDHPEYNRLEKNMAICGFRDALHAADLEGLKEAKTIFTNSTIVSGRLREFNGVDSEVLYPPVFRPERYRNWGSNDEIVCICRLEHHKRQHLLVEAMAHVKSPVRLRLCGSSNGKYPQDLDDLLSMLRLNRRVVIDNRWITEEEKVQLLGNCLAAAYVPLDEDSYGYPTIEAALASKPLISTTDAGGVSEFVTDGWNGYMALPDPEAIAEAIDKMYFDREKTRQMGENARNEVATQGITWERVLQRLLA
ncbi:glycosyl transferase family 1 [Blastopirellula marina]|uniref:Glycosyl transferase family 1 n=1 Tax=Blastopirellula marina TaxID=124 RepID=A0A2S8G3V2_9BACT|nr:MULTISPECIES: glycosyltransferase family 4 protein [Pirellulaceae]PQO38824.1 glycosyl transferase family 1 [Blastopirellula marina]RCS55132.1 glycosyltransferase [Bremerella cremea]